jgi:hypothetical protein
MVNVWGRIDRIAPHMSDDERERRDAVRADWIDSSKVAVAPTLDPDTIAARKERARQVAYADARRERQQTASRQGATSRGRDPYHRLREGGTI